MVSVTKSFKLNIILDMSHKTSTKQKSVMSHTVSPVTLSMELLHMRDSLLVPRTLIYNVTLHQEWRVAASKATTHLYRKVMKTSSTLDHQDTRATQPNPINSNLPSSKA
jgi:hypothetical protein